MKKQWKKGLIMVLGLISFSVSAQSPTLEFDGVDDYVDLGTNVGNNMRTIECWFSPTNSINGPIAAPQVLLARDEPLGNNTSSWNLTIGIDGNIIFSVQQEGAATSYPKATSNFNVWSADKWHHVAGVIHPTMGLLLFINGVLQIDGDPYNTASYSNNAITTIGRQGNFSIRYFAGKIEDVHITSDALYHTDFTPPCPDRSTTINSLGLWHLNEATGTTTSDFLNSNNGSIQGATWSYDTICPISTDCVDDNQNLTSATLNGTILTIEIECGDPVSVDLSDLCTDDQGLTNATLNGSLLTISIEDGTPVTVDLSTLNTDNQNLTGAVLDPTTGILTISIQGGSSTQVDLSSLVNSSDHDWYDAGNVGNSPTNINNSIYTFGNVGINHSAPSAQLHIQANAEPNDPFRISGNNARLNVSQGGNIGIGYNADTNVLISATNAYLASPTQHGARYILNNLQTQSGSVASGIRVINNSPNNKKSAGVLARATAAKRAYGVIGFSRGTGLMNYGHYGNAKNGEAQSHGVFGIVPGGEIQGATQFTSGVTGYNTSQLTATNFGGRFIATGQQQTQTNYGIYASASGANLNIAGYFNGTVALGGITFASDRKFKKEIQPLGNALELIQKLQPKTYLFKTNEYAEFNFEEDEQMGLIAQEVQEVLPNIVQRVVRPADYDSLGNLMNESVEYKAVNYVEMVPLLIAGVQEQQTVLEEQELALAAKDEQIKELAERLSRLENCLNNILPILCDINNSAVLQNTEETQQELMNFINVSLSDNQNITLEQNVPNPFAEQTTINFTIPTSIKKAQIIFYDGTGRLIKSVEIIERGNGRINVFASDLSSGIYTYSLITDGTIIATKKMSKTN